MLSTVGFFMWSLVMFGMGVVVGFLICLTKEKV
jgi:hypothetical protein